MYTIGVYLLFITLIFMVGAFLFVGSVILVLIEAGSEAMARAGRKYARAAADLQLPAPSFQMEPDRTATRARTQA